MTVIAKPEAVSSDPVAARTVGWLAVVVTITIALGLTLLRARSDTPPSMPAAGLLGFFAAFAGPGLVATVGLVRRRSQLLLASAIALICLAPLSMGGATLPLLIPALILVYVAGRMPASGLGPFRSVVVTLLTIGLLAAAPIGLFATTQVVCWDDYGGGNVVVQVLPEMPNEGSVAPFGSGCSSGSISTLGGALAVLSVAAAVCVAAGSTSPRLTEPLAPPRGRNVR